MWIRKGIDLNFKKQNSNDEKIINFSRAYATFIIKSLLYIIQPLKILNTTHQTFIDYNPEYCVIKERISWGKDHFVRYHGQVNYLLLFIYMMVRFLILANHLIWVYFKDQVAVARVCDFMGVQLDSVLMMKTLFNSYSARATTILVFLSLLMFLCYQMEFEMNIFTLQSIFESVYYIIMTMTTVGFGDIFAKSYFG
jgi:hypothetical protein